MVVVIGGADGPTAIFVRHKITLIPKRFLAFWGIVVAGVSLVFGLMRLCKKKK